jgi:type IV pilus assembly protein PilB
VKDDELLQELQNKGLLGADVAAKLKREVLLSGRALEELIFEKRLVDDAKIAELKSRIFGVPYQKVDLNAFDQKLTEVIPEETVRTYGVAPIVKQGDLLVVGMLHPDDVKAQEALKFIANQNRLNLGVYLISWSDWQGILRRYSPYKSSVEAAVRALKSKPGQMPLSRRVVALEEAMAKGEEEAPVIKIVSDTFAEAVQTRASDVHFEPQENYLRIRFRVDGELREAASLPLELAQPIVSRIKVLSNLKLDEVRVPQDGRFRSPIFNREIDFRVSTFPTPLGEKVAVRVLDPTTGLKSLNELGLTGRNSEIINNGLQKPFGMILITGPTGSGKTTTLYALMQQLNKEDVNIVSLEDPVEYFISGVNQSQVWPEIGYDFASGLRQILRQDPDVIMVGEIRDNETASLAVQAALTGHIVLSTLHTNNSVGVIPRLLDMKVEPFLLPVSLNLMVSQRLVGLLCDGCKKPEEAPAAMAKLIEQALQGLPAETAAQFKKPYRIYHAAGCPKCKNRGVIGRVAIFEVLAMSPGLAEAIETGPTLQKLVKEARAQGMLDLRQDGVIKALQGLVSMEEVLRSTEEI